MKTLIIATILLSSNLLGAEVVAGIGRKAIFYRRSHKKDFKHIEF